MAPSIPSANPRNSPAVMWRGGFIVWMASPEKNIVGNARDVDETGRVPAPARRLRAGLFFLDRGETSAEHEVALGRLRVTRRAGGRALRCCHQSSVGSVAREFPVARSFLTV